MCLWKFENSWCHAQRGLFRDISLPLRSKLIMLRTKICLLQSSYFFLLVRAYTRLTSMGLGYKMKILTSLYILMKKEDHEKQN